MSERLYQMHETESGTHILIFKENEGGHGFERKVFVPVSEYNPDHLVHVLGSGFRELFAGSRKSVADWLRVNKSAAKMVAVGKDFQLLSVEEYISLHG